MTRAALFALTAALIACGVSMGPVLASHDEYRVWRKIRLSENHEERARLLHTYLDRWPRGYFAERAATEERELDERFYSAGMTEIHGLRSYLRAFPHGVHAEQARYRLASLVEMERARATQVAESERRRTEMEARLEEGRRAWCARTAETWLSVLAGVSGWGDPLDVALGRSVTFATAWNGQPAATCEGDVCTKDLPHHYYIQVRGATRVDRDMKLRIRLNLAAGTTPEEAGRRLVGAEITFPDGGFVACQELAQQVEIDAEDADAVESARRTFGDAMVAAVRAAFPEPPAAPAPEGTATPAAPAATAAPAAPSPLRLERLVRSPLAIEVWRGAPAPAEGASSSPLVADGIRIVFEPPVAAPGRPGVRPPPTKAPAKVPPTKAPARAPAKAPPTKAPAKVPAR